jgi:hypothetical protein
MPTIKDTTTRNSHRSVVAIVKAFDDDDSAIQGEVRIYKRIGLKARAWGPAEISWSSSPGGGTSIAHARLFALALDEAMSIAKSWDEDEGNIPAWEEEGEYYDSSHQD